MQFTWSRCSECRPRHDCLPQRSLHHSSVTFCSKTWHRDQPLSTSSNVCITRCMHLSKICSLTGFRSTWAVGGQRCSEINAGVIPRSSTVSHDRWAGAFRWKIQKNRHISRYMTGSSSVASDIHSRIDEYQVSLPQHWFLLGFVKKLWLQLKLIV